MSTAATTRVPAGIYELILTRGPEYRLVRRKIDVRANETTTVGIALERYADLPGGGWYPAIPTSI